MAIVTVVFFSLVLLCGVRDVHARARLRDLAQQVRQLAGEVNSWKLTAVNRETKMANNFKVLESSLKQHVTETFVPNLIKRLVKQAITDILNEEYTGNSISGRASDEIDSKKASVRNTKAQPFRDVERERDTYKDSLGKLRLQLTKHIHTLQIQLNQTQSDLRDARMLNTGLRKDFMTLNSSCWMIRKEIEEHSKDEQSYKEGVQHMQQKLRAGIQSIKIQLSQTIEDLHDSKQNITILKEDLTTLNRSCVRREENTESGVTQESQKTSLLSLVSLATLPSSYLSTPAASIDPSQDQSPSEMVPPVPGTTEESDLNATRSHADHDLYNASRDGDLEAVRRILSVGLANVNCRVDGRTPVMAAAWNGHRDVVELLVREEANVTLVDEHRNNILHYACRGGDIETVKLVLSLDVVGINSKGYKTGTPLMVAAQYGHREVVDLLLRSGANAAYVDFVGDNILIWACEGGDVETVKLVLSLNVVDINSPGWRRRTPVIDAAKHGHRDVVELLVKEGADVTQVDDIGENTLHWACVGGDLETVKLVLSLNIVDINRRGWRSRTPVMVAARYGPRKLVELLVTKGANVSLVDNVNDNILHYACRGGDMEMVKLVLSLNVVGINSRGQNSVTPVIVAARWKHRDIVELLVTEGADVSLVDDSHSNILHWACLAGDLETVKLVLSLHVADINARSDYGHTALELARFWGHPQVVDLLVSRGGQ
ncbi:ankyrin repeat domain-containing protein 17-like [Haliotis rubra]|uniref:ankyrin repeat domain-containing protein 17-like n=1 Tax=Haliotis rubra TaxID=36100 RepID=UPI001EE53995|nr:ankyrin repeat domain-containing protein 17-like [Haliotis rubra]